MHASTTCLNIQLRNELSPNFLKQMLQRVDPFDQSAKSLFVTPERAFQIIRQNVACRPKSLVRCSHFLLGLNDSIQCLLKMSDRIRSAQLAPRRRTFQSFEQLNGISEDSALFNQTVSKTDFSGIRKLRVSIHHFGYSWCPLE
jgi:hypothetical protein